MNESQPQQENAKQKIEIYDKSRDELFNHQQISGQIIGTTMLTLSTLAIGFTPHLPTSALNHCLFQYGKWILPSIIGLTLLSFYIGDRAAYKRIIKLQEDYRQILKQHGRKPDPTPTKSINNMKHIIMLLYTIATFIITYLVR